MASNGYMELVLSLQIIKEYTGKEAKSYFENVKEPARGVEAKTYSDELEARQGIANNIYELLKEGKLRERSNAEIESLLLQNSKSEEETKYIKETLNKIKEEIKGQKLSNMLDKVETEWATGTGFKSGDAASIMTKLLRFLMKGRK